MLWLFEFSCRLSGCAGYRIGIAIPISFDFSKNKSKLYPVEHTKIDWIIITEVNLDWNWIFTSICAILKLEYNDRQRILLAISSKFYY